MLIESAFMGSLAHADDLRSLTCDPHSCGEIIKEFLTENFLLLNTDKCELTHGCSTKNSLLMWVQLPWNQPLPQNV